MCAAIYDIAEMVSKAEDRRVVADNGYRILDLLVEANLARPVESSNAYVANARPDCPHGCISLVRDKCGQTTHIDDDYITGNVRQAAEAVGSSPVRPAIEVRGTFSERGDQLCVGRFKSDLWTGGDRLPIVITARPT